MRNALPRSALLLGCALAGSAWALSEFGIEGMGVVSTPHSEVRGAVRPDGQRIVFTRKREDSNYDIYTIRPDGTDLFRCTDHGSSDGHAVWSADGRILWSGSQHGFRDEAALYEQTFQQYGQIYVMNADGSNKRLLTDSKWEDSMPLFVPKG